VILNWLPARTVNETAIVTGDGPPVIVMVSEYIPAVNPVAFTVTLSAEGVEPVVGTTVSQLCVKETVKLVAEGAVN